MPNDLGDRMKGYEMAEAGRKLMPMLPALARIDGRSFSKFTAGLERPYDRRLSSLMVEVTRFLVQQANAACGYTQSDEITLAWHSPTPDSQLFFDGRISKMGSVLASMATACFLYRLPGFLPAELAARLPHFDCRVWNVPTPEEAANAFLWREWDATKNSISMAARHSYSARQLLHRSGAQMQEMLWQKGVNWNDYPAFFKRGTYVRRRKVCRRFTAEELDKLPPLHEARKDPNLMVERTDVATLELPPLARISNRVGVLFRDEEPQVNEAAAGEGQSRT
jgi:tRNA(His) guanylyltransferase